jgi:hypothetical protein
VRRTRVLSAAVLALVVAAGIAVVADVSAGTAASPTARAAVVGGIQTGSSTLTTTPSPLTPTPTPAAGSGPPTAWACRTGLSHAGLTLDVTGTVCLRFAARQWQGHARLTLANRGPVIAGTVSLFTSAGLNPGTRAFHLAAKQTLIVEVGVTGTVGADNRVVRSEAIVHPDWLPGYGSGDKASLTSPTLFATHTSAAPLRSTRVGTRSCVPGKFAYGNVSAKYTYCTQQVRGRQVDTGSITYRTGSTSVKATVYLGQLINGVPVATTQVLLPGTAKPVTIALPTMSTQLLVGDRNAQIADCSDTTALSSKPVPIR